MKILKKILGLFLILIAGLLSMITLGTLITAIKNVVKSPTHKDLPYLIAFIILVFFLALIVIYMIKLGLRLIKRETISEDSIEDIGS
jgi:TRAP-type C4-dicarboxylate transport system permease small subunit